MKRHQFGKLWRGPAAALLALATAAPIVRAEDAFNQANFQSDIPGEAANTDPSLVNPWGITYGPTTPFWIADNATGVTTLYNTTGAKLPLTVSLPNPAGGTILPTGTVFNGTSSFNGDRFLFASVNGVIDGWRGALGTTGEVLVNASASGAAFTGLASGTVAGNNYLYAADFHNARIDVVPASGAPALSGMFTDPTLPAGFAPFNVQQLGGQLYVTYAMQDAARQRDVAGAGNGYVDIFNLNGVLQRRLVSQGALNSPWGVALAPQGFGPFGGDLLVGNFGDGRINVYDPSTGNFIDTLRRKGGSPLAITGLWGIIFGNGAAGGNRDSLYFAAGIAGNGQKGDHGLFGAVVSAVPESSTLIGGGALAALCSIALCLRLWRERQVSAIA